MESLWREKGQPHKDSGAWNKFNGIPLELSLADIDSLEPLVVGESLPELKGPTYHHYGPYSEDYKTEDLKFVEQARMALSGGSKVYYVPSY